jgi:alcohol dehydrogenase (cytochrome c)
MHLRAKLMTSAATLVAAAALTGTAYAQSLAEPGKDWETYHGGYKSWHYSPLKQINTDNVSKLKVAFIEQVGHSTRGLETMPLAKDGILYYSGSYSKVFAVNGATGEMLWSYVPKLDEETVARQTHSPYNRGMAMGDGKLYVGTVDGRLIALDMKTGQPVWDTKLVNSQKLTVGFTGAPLLVKDKVVIGCQGGEWPYRGPIFGVNAKTGEKVWEFDTVGGTPEAMKTWGNESWRTGGGGGWMPGTYDTETNTVWWGTGNPAPLYDWAGSNWKTEGPRPGDNLYTTSVIALDPDTGKLKAYHQELPHDAWDFDSAVGEFVQIDQGGKKLYLHPNKSGYFFVYDRAPGQDGKLKIENVYNVVKNSNFVKGIDPKTGELQGRRDMPEGKQTNLCPFIGGGVSWNSGTYNPETGLYYKIVQEVCMDLEIVKTQPVTEPVAQLNIGATFTFKDPVGDKMHGHLDARDPITGKLAWTVNFPEPPVASLLSTAGGLLFVPDARGWLRVLDVKTGKELWKANDGIIHNGGIMTYEANGKQYVATVTGFPAMLSENYPEMFGGAYKYMEKDTGALIVYTLE